MILPLCLYFSCLINLSITTKIRSTLHNGVNRGEGFFGTREMITASDVKECPVGCDIHGFCSSSGECKCKEGYFGSDCSIAGICLNGCNESGRCSEKDGSCICDEGRRGSSCESYICQPECVHGECLNGNCFCEQEFYGSDCSIRTTSVSAALRKNQRGKKPKNNDSSTNNDSGQNATPIIDKKCGAHGILSDGNICVCHGEYRGLHCNHPIKDDSNSNFKSREAVIQTATNEEGNNIISQRKNKGKKKIGNEFDIEYSVCPNACNGNGICVMGECFCNENHIGKECEHPICGGSIAECSGNGHCDDGVCKCQDDYIGKACEILLAEVDADTLNNILQSPNDNTTRAAETTISEKSLINSGKEKKWTPPAGTVCVDVILNLPSKSILDFDHKTRIHIEDEITKLFKSLKTFESFTNHVKVTTVSVGSSTEISELYSVTIHLQVKVPTALVSSVIFKVKKSFQNNSSVANCFLQNPPSISDYCLAEYHKDCYCSGHGICDSTGTCQCEDRWTGPACDSPTCPTNHCGNNGICNQEGVCECFDGWEGDGCHIRTCVADCNNNGKCIHDGVYIASCECFEGYAGESCERHISCAVSYDKKDADHRCSNRGTCQSNVCYCPSGYSGVECEVEDCIPANCNGNGECLSKQCQCKQGWTGDSCDQRTCINDCNGRGLCDGTMCKCDEGWLGSSCEIPAIHCPFSCNHHRGFGECIDQVCVCKQGYSGIDCGVKHCKDDCTVHGFCVVTGPADKQHLGGTCVCDDFYYGEFCEIEGCPHGSTSTEKGEREPCDGHGACLQSSAGEFICECEDNWGGDACDEQTCDIECSHGKCVDGHCMCDSGYGHAPEREDCSLEFCPSDCNMSSNQGICVNDQYCECSEGWTGQDCGVEDISSHPVLNVHAGVAHEDPDTFDCPVWDCNGHGDCTKHGCECHVGYEGEACACPSSCLESKTCTASSINNNTCQCAQGYKGDDCSIDTCYDITCSGHGTCTGGECVCNDGYFGVDCADIVGLQSCAKEAFTHCSAYCVGGSIEYLKECDANCNENCIDRCVEHDGKFQKTCFTL